jgi:hypothetical protein
MEQVENIESFDEELNVDSVEITTEMVHYPFVKRMLTALDKFLERRIAGIGIIYFCSLIIGGICILVNGVAVSASGGGSGDAPISFAFIYSTLAVLSFVFLLVLARLYFVRRHKTEK